MKEQRGNPSLTALYQNVTHERYLCKDVFNTAGKSLLLLY